MSELPETLADGRYAIVRVLGEGAQGATLEAVDKREGRPVAVKRFSVRGAKSWKDVELAEREARVLSSLSHPGLPAYVDHFEEDGCLYLVMERIEGESLLELERRGARFDQVEVVRFLNEASAVLDYLHSRSPPVIHRDIKPGNVVRRPDGSFVIVDFGSVRDSLKPEGGSTVVGTFGYMAPEQFQGRALPASDVYAVGATALRLLTRREPEALPHRGLAIDVEQALRGQVAPSLVRVLSRMLDPDPDRRAPRIEPLLESLDDVPRRPRRPRPEPRRPHPRQRPRARAPAGSGILASPVPVTLVFLGLWVASVALWAMLEVLVPTLLVLLSIALGPQLRRAAVTSRQAGRRGRAALVRARRRLVERADEAAAARHRARVSAPPPPAPPRVRVEPVAPDTAAQQDEELTVEPTPGPRMRQRRGSW